MPQGHIMRYLEKHIRKDIKKKMVILSGPRQTGKTYLSKIIVKNNGIYLNWDIKQDQKIIREIAWPKDVTIVVLDELHKYLKWKSFLKGIVDEFQNKPNLLITGSAKLELFRHEGDALTGRYYSYRLHPIDLAESRSFLKGLSAETRVKRLLKAGGFPEAFLHPDQAERLRNDRFDLVVQEDLRDLNKTNSVRGMKLLIELLRERAGKPLNYSNLALDIGVSPVTVKTWIDILEDLYIIFRIYPYSKGLARSLRKEPKVYFYDCAAGYSNDRGPIIENMVACALLKYCHLLRDAYGKKLDLYYYKDKEKREVDFVVISNRNVQWCIEVKSQDDSLSPHIEYLSRKITPKESIQLVMDLQKPKERKKTKILPLVSWLDNLID
ncbi:MAG: AAA family ATPase [Elusimicrobia bacterium]|nr:AAA family ATPase [Elusimicrobiota bacterium]MBD3411529.1 AAA family ATPase [Elusimicrobiota bacterium]